MGKRLFVLRIICYNYFTLRIGGVVMEYDIVVLGAGPAGLSAAIYGRRAGLSVLILDAGAPGGKMNLTAELENWPGDQKVAGPELAFRMYDHAIQLGATQLYGNVSKIEVVGDLKKVTCDDQKEYYGKNIIIATGTKERPMGIKNEKELTGRGVSYCAVCDGPFFRNEEVAVVGGGNSALQEADYLTRFCSKVHLIVRRDVFRADKAVQDKVINNDKVEIHFLKKPVEVLEKDNKVLGLRLEDSKTQIQEDLFVNAIFPFIGLDPVTDFCQNLGILNEQGYVITDENMTTKIPGIYAAGDVRQKFLRQVVTATNDGAIAAQHISHTLGH